MIIDLRTLASPRKKGRTFPNLPIPNPKKNLPPPDPRDPGPLSFAAIRSAHAGDACPDSAKTSSAAQEYLPLESVLLE